VNGIIVGAVLVGLTFGGGALLQRTLRDRLERHDAEEAERDRCDAERDALRDAEEAAYAQAGGYVDIAGLVAFGLIAAPPEHHVIKLLGTSGQARDYDAIGEGPCAEDASDADPRTMGPACEYERTEIQSAVDQAAASPEPDDWSLYISDVPDFFAVVDGKLVSITPFC
jgi:hypothetical protein